MKRDKKIKDVKFVGLKINKELHRWLLLRAESNGRSLAQEIRFLIGGFKEAEQNRADTI